MLGQHRSTQRKVPRGADDEQALTEASRECLALVVARQLKHEDVLAALADLFISRGPPAHIRSDNGSEFIATAVQQWLGQIGVKTLYITPGSPWENGYNERLGFARPAAQRVASRRTAQRRDLLQPRRSQGADRSLAVALQHRPPA
ncbi:transposase InsO family protein [Sphingobium sp. OAS761]|nr:transposase InsO family protein [Sphingobium sp. OAS761]